MSRAKDIRNIFKKIFKSSDKKEKGPDDKKHEQEGTSNKNSSGLRWYVNYL